MWALKTPYRDHSRYRGTREVVVMGIGIGYLLGTAQGEAPNSNESVAPARE